VGSGGAGAVGGQIVIGSGGSAGQAANGGGSPSGGAPGTGASAGEMGRDGGPDGPAQCLATSIPGASVSWKDDGDNECAVAVTISRFTNATVDSLMLHANTTSTGAGPGFTIAASVAPPMKLEGSYVCLPDGGSGIPLTYGNFSANDVVDCTVTITSAGISGGAHTTGSFSARYRSDGGFKTISEGLFDVPVP